jgi:cbb3-type cytochrome oxidase subunit 1
MLLAFAHWLQDLPFPQWVGQSSFAFPSIETMHVICISTVVGTICIVDLRLLNIASRSRLVSELTGELLPFTWGAFALAAITGLMLFASKATEYVANGFFISKMLLIGLAAINMLVFHFTVFKDVGSWDQGASPPRAAKLAGALSLTLWAAVIVCGRWIGFTMTAG